MKQKTEDGSKETKQIIFVVIISIVLLIFAGYLYIQRNSTPEIPDEPKEEEIVKPPEEEEEVIIKDIPLNEYCDKNMTVHRSQSQYAEFIYISGFDEEGCAIISNKDNRGYISRKSQEAVAKSQEKQHLFATVAEELGLSEAYSIKSDQITIKNENNNVIGWALQLIYSDGANSGRYVLNQDDVWTRVQ